MREIELGKLLGGTPHPNIVQFIGCVTTEGKQQTIGKRWADMCEIVLCNFIYICYKKVSYVSTFTIMKEASYKQKNSNFIYHDFRIAFYYNMTTYKHGKCFSFGC